MYNQLVKDGVRHGGKSVSKMEVVNDMIHRNHSALAGYKVCLKEQEKEQELKVQQTVAQKASQFRKEDTMMMMKLPILPCTEKLES